MAPHLSTLPIREKTPRTKTKYKEMAVNRSVREKHLRRPSAAILWEDARPLWMRMVVYSMNVGMDDWKVIEVNIG